MRMGLSLLLACGGLIKLVEKARTGNPIGVRAEMRSKRGRFACSSVSSRSR